MAFGLYDTHYIDFAEEQTEAKLRGGRTRVGVSFVDIVRRVDAAMRAANQDDALMKELMFRTTKDTITSFRPTERIWQYGPEFTRNRPQRGMTTGAYSLPLYFYEMDVSFTERALKVMSLEVLETELKGIVMGISRGHRGHVLQRLFNPDEAPLNMDGAGATPGFAGSGTGSNVFEGLFPNGTVIPSGYTHYHHAADTTEAIEAAIDTMVDKMIKWHRPAFDLIAPQDVVDRIKASTKFVGAGSSLIIKAEKEDRVSNSVSSEKYEGVYGDHVRVRYADNQIDGNAFAIYKSYGAGSQNNPLAWRWDESFGQDTYVEDRALMPMAQASILQTYGVGVGNRVGAALCSVGSGSDYTPPNIIL